MKTKQILNLAGMMFFTFCCLGTDEKNNLLYGTTYTLTPSPNYALTTGKEDSTDLTDGKITPGNDPMWIFRQCVGWDKPVGPIKITFDLGKPKEIANVKFHVGANAGNVTWPKMVSIEGSMDGSNFHKIGSLNILSKKRYPAPDVGYRRHIYDASFIPVKIRYLRLRCVIGGMYLFCDEVEAYPPEKKQKIVSLNSLEKVVSDAELITSSGKWITMESISARIAFDSKELADQIKKSRLSGVEKNSLLHKLKKICSKKLPLPEDISDFRSVVPLNETHAAIFALHGRLLQKSGITDPVIESAEPYAAVFPMRKLEKQSPPKIDLFMMNGEYRAKALNIMNPSTIPMNVSFEKRDLPADFFKVEYIDTNTFRMSSTAIVPVDKEFIVPAGMTVQLFIRFHPINLPAGMNTYHLNLACGTNKISIPVKLKISKVSFPKELSLSTGFFDYIDFGKRKYSWNLQRKDLERIIEIEKEYFINSTFALHGIGHVSKPDLGQTGPLDFSAFDSWISQWPDAKHYYIYMALNTASGFGKISTEDPNFRKSVAEWAKKWEKHLEKKRIPPEKIVFYFIDEQSNESMYKRTAQWINAAREGAKRIRMFINPLKLNGLKPEYLSNVDIVAPIYDLLLKNGNIYGNKELQVYNCLEGPFSALPWYYRRQAWLAAKYNATGSFFWSIADCGGNMNGWNQYLTKIVYFSPLILSKGSPCVTKHLEAFREGCQDYEYIQILKKQKSKKQFIYNAINSVIAKGREAEAERWRIAILAEIDKLSSEN